MLFWNAMEMQLINALNPVVAGWSNYFSTVISTNTYLRLDHWLYAQLNHWASHRHLHKNQRWIANKYWLIDQGEGWTFAAKTPDSIVRLARHNATAIKRHVKVQSKRSSYDAVGLRPADGVWVYWSSRMGRHP
jgi:RNA-directed DNA polymerase